MIRLSLKLILVAFLYMVLSGELMSSELSSINTCFSKLDGNQLIIGNKVIERIFFWNEGNLRNKSLIDKRTGSHFNFNSRQGCFSIPGLTDTVLQVEMQQKIVPETSVSPEHLDVEVHNIYEAIEVKRVFSIYPDCPAISCNYFVWLKSGKTTRFKPEETVLERYGFVSNHWKYKAVEFFDRTDVNNNLVREQEIVGYNKPVQMKGNILHVQDMLSEKSFFLLKVAPCSFVQLHYPGYDFSCSKHNLQVFGIGISPEDLIEDEWVKTYGMVVGLAGTSELDFLLSLRNYQKNIRIHRSDRDEMIMMNTWGDRNRDTKISEKHIKNEIDACKKYGITHLQVDDGWQQGMSRGTAKQKGIPWISRWEVKDWQPSKERLPNGLERIVNYAKEQGIILGLWFAPSSYNEYETWNQDADIIINLFKTYGIKYFKVDNVDLPTKRAEINFKSFLDRTMKETGNKVVFNFDETNGIRTGYHYLNHYGNIFLENRYTDFASYYPFMTLRNLWMLSRYVPAENFQIEFLNKWRNKNKYLKDDPFAPYNIPFDFQFAITLLAQPLAWFEASNLPKSAESVILIIKEYLKHQHAIHSGIIVPIGNEPNGKSWTGFQSIINVNEGYLMIYREYNDQNEAIINTFLPESKQVQLNRILGDGEPMTTTVGKNGSIDFNMPEPYSFGLFKYKVND